MSGVCQDVPLFMEKLRKIAGWPFRKSNHAINTFDLADIILGIQDELIPGSVPVSIRNGVVGQESPPSLE